MAVTLLRRRALETTGFSGYSGSSGSSSLASYGSSVGSGELEVPSVTNGFTSTIVNGPQPGTCECNRCRCAVRRHACDRSGDRRFLHDVGMPRLTDVLEGLDATPPRAVW